MLYEGRSLAQLISQKRVGQVRLVPRDVQRGEELAPVERGLDENGESLFAHPGPQVGHCRPDNTCGRCVAAVLEPEIMASARPAGARERLEFDHIVPLSRGRGAVPERNVELLCEFLQSHESQAGSDSSPMSWKRGHRPRDVIV